MPKPIAPQFSLSIYTNPKDLARVQKRLDKYKGASLEKVIERAQSGAASMIVPSLRSAAPVGREDKKGRYPHEAGNLQRRIRAKSLRKRTGEAGAAYAGTTTYYGLFVQQGGAVNRRANPFVEQVTRQLEPEINNFQEEQIRRLA